MVGKKPWMRSLTCFVGIRRRGTFGADQSGATAVEFGFVALPFLMMVFFIINIGLYYFAINSLDKGVIDASRQILTGSAQTSGLTVGQFKTLVCNQANVGGSAIDCSKLSILVTSSTVSWADLINKAGGQSCTSNGSLSAGTGQSTDLLSTYTTSGSNNVFVLVTACYGWSGSKILPFFTFNKLSDGTTLIQSANAMAVEPFS